MYLGPGEVVTISQQKASHIAMHLGEARLAFQTNLDGNFGIVLKQSARHRMSVSIFGGYGRICA